MMPVLRGRHFRVWPGHNAPTRSPRFNVLRAGRRLGQTQGERARVPSRNTASAP